MIPNTAGGGHGRGPSAAETTRLDRPARNGATVGGVAGIVLAGVHTWGESAFEELTARPLLPVLGRPLVWHVLRWLRRWGIPEATVCGNSDTSLLQASLGNGDALDLSLEYGEDVMPRGPAGCARDAAIPSQAETFIVADGTILPRTDLSALLRQHRRSRAAVTLVVSGPTQGLPDEAPEPVGLYVFSRAALEAVPPTGHQDIKETLIPDLHRRGERITTFAAPAGSIPRVSDAASYLAVNMWAMETLAQHGAPPDDCVRVRDAWVHRSAQVDSTARFVGPVLVGPNSVVEAGVMIVGPTTVGADCTVGRQSVVSRSVVWDRCRVGAGAIVDHCVLANDVVVEAGLVVRESCCLLSTRPRRGLLAHLPPFRWSHHPPRMTRHLDLRAKPASASGDGRVTAAARVS